MRLSLTLSQAHACTDTFVLCTSIQARHPPFFFLIIIPLAILSSTIDSFNVYTDQPVPAHSRLVYRLGVINLIHAYPGTYVFCFCSHHLCARDKKPGKCRSNRCEKRRRHP